MLAKAIEESQATYQDYLVKQKSQEEDEKKQKEKIEIQKRKLAFEEAQK